MTIPYYILIELKLGAYSMTDISKYEFETRDELDRKPIAERIRNLLVSGDAYEFFPLLVDGDWGAGKTEFLFKLKNYLATGEAVGGDITGSSNSNCYVSYINAFSTDYYHDPFMVIVREVYDLLGKKGSRKDLKALFHIIKRAAPELVGIAANFSIPFLAENIQQAMRVMSRVSKAIDKSQELAYEKQLKEFLISVNNLSDFKTILQETIQNIGGEYVLIIDELDRCKPDYAVKLLEMSKHLFDVKGLYIIYGANSKYLKSNISKTYMDGDLSEDYLSKFFNLRVFLSSRIDRDLQTLNDYEANYQYFKNVFLAEDAGVGRAFSGGFLLLDDDSVDTCPYINPIKDTLKNSISAFLGDRELRERERIFKSVRISQVLCPDILVPYPEGGEMQNEEDFLRLMAGPFNVILAISLVLDGEVVMIDNVINAEVISIPNERGIHIGRYPVYSKTLHLETIKNYLIKKKISNINEIYPYLRYKPQDDNIIKSTELDIIKSDFRHKFYGLNVLKRTLKALYGFSLK